MCLRRPGFEMWILELDPLDFQLRRLGLTLDLNSRIPHGDHGRVKVGHRTRIWNRNVFHPNPELEGLRIDLIDDDRLTDGSHLEGRRVRRSDRRSDGSAQNGW